MGNVCGVQMPFRVRPEEQDSKERGRGNLLRQLSYDIYKIEGVFDSRDDLQENWLTRRPSKRYYGVTNSTTTQIHPQLPSTLSTFRSARMASFSDRTRSQQPREQPSPRSELTVKALGHSQQVYAETSSPSSASASSSDLDSDSNQSDQAPSVGLALEQGLEKSARVKESH